ncbi:MAG: methionine--tRNA ligase subunit beta [Candidatus Levybacteria bacterium RIFOXYA1_FULL_41_10]|nr:MAG: Methionine-tRNA ligase [Candidatus Levybacteria bacterium GW2011_GWA1_39_34]KKR51288.1 MAG: Methionine-tRNA ligase [Candidatus Levybacteria bacterium GW2011_GWC1_40_19]KKR73830.1 MAG: Methionine-tRNA ligase [Candidatus Levybacteria bacterium GW2011_GWC2_40_7]KKR94626.1 MAG: Methionine-tRNA ligase [Candidatus Levybacteria bacterium GW2011_GWA2_41_15]KKS00728.1 MAG: Methionine-tRNA ligase [Candidatus Levybacteria bacterium GW2011_GWB1_41_21]OGH20960.1 MAG: methionine--tRNA ligase subunit
MNIDLEDFKKVKIKIGKITLVEKVPDADKLLRLEVDFGSETRQVVSGIAESYSPEELIGREFPFVVNLETRSFRGIESQGMILAIDAKEKTILIAPLEEVEPGAEVI